MSLPAVLLIFYLLAQPREIVRCSLWLSDGATPQQVTAACGKINLDRYSVNFRNINNGQIYCRKSAIAVYSPSRFCRLPFTLDNFKMEIYEKTAGNEILCVIKTGNPTPTRSEILDACPPEAVTLYDAESATLEFIQEIAPQPEAAPACQIPTPQQPAAPSDLATGEPYAWLAGRLIWHGLVTPDCDGYSGLDPVTLAANQCGIESAAQAVHHWQNQFDPDIYAAALAEDVPADLLKRVLAAESQFWPYWENRPAGETGLAQITHAAADQYLRWYDAEYPGLPTARQYEQQVILLQSLKCDYCNLRQAAAKEKRNIYVYARILRAYRCAANDWRSALVAWNGQAYAERILQ